MMYRKTIFFTVALTFFLAILGAFVRLSDAGLGCPDWPACYGRVVAPYSDNTLQSAQESFPQHRIDSGKAWSEMFHRYVAGVLGLLIVAIAIMAWRLRRQLRQSPLLPTALVGLVIFQAALGMWTVTLLLKPAIVTLHLLGGMATLGLLVWLAMRQTRLSIFARSSASLGLRALAWLGLIVLFLQIALGGWVSANYAALACPDVPMCNSEWLPAMDFHQAFHVLRELGMTASGELLSHDALTAIHWSHRVGAIITLLTLVPLSLFALRKPQLKLPGLALLLLVTIQLGLGVTNVLASLPLLVAVAHNGIAALLLITLVVLNFRINSRVHQSKIWL